MSHSYIFVLINFIVDSTKTEREKEKENGLKLMLDSYPCRVQHGNKNSEQQNKKPLIDGVARIPICALSTTTKSN